MRIEDVIKASGMTREELSRKMRINISTINKYSSGERKPTVENAKKIGKMFGFNWWELFED